MMLPAMKAARLIWQASTPHFWAERNCPSSVFSWAQMLLLRLAFVMPGLTAMLWVGRARWRARGLPGAPAPRPGPCTLSGTGLMLREWDGGGHAHA